MFSSSNSKTIKKDSTKNSIKNIFEIKNNSTEFSKSPNNLSQNSKIGLNFKDPIPRLNNIGNHIIGNKTKMSSEDNKDEGFLTVIDSRTKKEITIPIKDGVVQAIQFRQLKLNDFDAGIRIYDNGFLNTAACTSKICSIDGESGSLRFRGYNIEDLAAKSNFLEVAFLLINGELPDYLQMKNWEHRIMKHTFVHSDLQTLLANFRYDAHPMGMLISAVSAMSTFHPEANPALAGNDIYKIGDEKSVRARNKQMYRIIGKMPTIAACAYRHRIGRPYNNPVNRLGYVENFLYMMDRLSETDYKPHPRISHALDVLFLLHCEHGLNASTSAMRLVGSTQVDPYSAVAAAASTLYGPLHGGANEAVLRMLKSIGSIENIPAFLADVKAKKRKLMGFGHRVYKAMDPRAKIIRKVAYEVFDILGYEPLIDIAVELEKQALQDEYFLKRRLFPNVDFFSGLIYKSMGFPTDMFPVLFCIPRTVGWLAHWLEQLDDPETKIYRPRQVYKGVKEREYVPVSQRSRATVRSQSTYVSQYSKRRAGDHVLEDYQFES